MIRGKITFEAEGFEPFNCDSITWNRKTRHLTAFGAYKLISKGNLQFPCVSPTIYIYLKGNDLIVGCEVR